jgi:hypothetical protein
MMFGGALPGLRPGRARCTVCGLSLQPVCIMIIPVTSPTRLSSKVSFLHVIDPIAFIRFGTHKFL